MFTLTCTAELAASVDVGVTVGVVWTGPDQFTSSDTMASLTAEASSHASQLMVASAAQSGDYTCAVTLDSASNFLTESNPATQVRPISVGELVDTVPYIVDSPSLCSGCPLLSCGDISTTNKLHYLLLDPR